MHYFMEQYILRNSSDKIIYIIITAYSVFKKKFYEKFEKYSMKNSIGSDISIYIAFIIVLYRITKI